MKHHNKAAERLAARRRGYDTLPAHLQSERKRPGSYKKDQPLGKKR